MVYNIVYNLWSTFYNIKPYSYNFVKSYLGLRQIAGGVRRKQYLSWQNVSEIHGDLLAELRPCTVLEYSTDLFGKS